MSSTYSECFAGSSCRNKTCSWCQYWLHDTWLLHTNLIVLSDLPYCLKRHFYKNEKHVRSVYCLGINLFNTSLRPKFWTIVFLLDIHSHLYNIFTPQPPPPFPSKSGLPKPQVWELSRLCPETPQRNCTFKNSVSHKVKEYPTSMLLRRSFSLHFSGELWLTKPKITEFNTTL
jgi:hypothetical protein